jgi:hypothetical protein
MAAVGCAANRRLCPPNEVPEAAPRVDLSPGAREYRPLTQEEYQVLTAPIRATASEGAGLEGRKMQVLALSGGGKFGAYSAGVLNGWTCSGQRPTLDIVTGVSTGSLVATYAFLGPQYDTRLRELYTTLRTDDVVRQKTPLAVLWSEALASSKPLARLIAREVDDQLLCQVAAAHQQGRRLFVATTNIDTKKLVIWDMGAIACSHRPDRLELYRAVLLASCSVPGALPPVTIPVTINGRCYEEKHVDGSTTSSLFFRTSMVNWQENDIQPGRRPLAGSDIYLVVAGKLYADPSCVQPKFADIAGSGVSALTYEQTRTDLIRIYMVSQLLGMRYHMAALRQDIPVDSNILKFEPAELERIFAAGFADGQQPQTWRRTPPESDPQEQIVPRTGTDFFAPGPFPADGQRRR